MKKRHFIIFFAVIVTLLLTNTRSCFAIGSIHGFSQGSSTVLIASANNVRASGGIFSNAYLVNTNESVNISLKVGKATKKFTARASSHHRSADYYYEGPCRYNILVNGEEYTAEKVKYVFKEPGDYVISGNITYRWKTSIGKRAAGFPAFYYRVVEVGEKIIRVSDLENAILPNLKDQDTDNLEKPEGFIAGQVSHTNRWNENRKGFNNYCEKNRKESWLRDENDFWSGEKFMLEAYLSGENLPSFVNVKIIGTDYKTTLMKGEEGYSGNLFQPSMIEFWDGKEAEPIEFLFSANIDGIICEDKVRIILRDLVKYWDMHRKE